MEDIGSATLQNEKKQITRVVESDGLRENITVENIVAENIAAVKTAAVNIKGEADEIESTTTKLLESPASKRPRK